MESSAERILAWPHPRRCRRRDHAHRPCAVDVVEDPAPLDRDAHGLEVVGVDRPEVDDRLLGRPERQTVDEDDVVAARSGQWRQADNTRGDHAGLGRQTIEQRAYKGRRRRQVRISDLRKVEINEREPLGLEAPVDMHQPLEAVKQEAGRGKADGAQADF